MAIVPKEYDDDAKFDETHWKELMGKLKPGGPAGFTTRRAEDVLVGIIDARRATAAVAWCLGYSYTDDDELTIVRKPPVRHPRIPYLWCDGVSYILRDPCGNADNENNQPHELAEVEGSFDKYGRYLQAELTLHFGIPRHLILTEDEALDYEVYEHFVYRYDVKPNLELLTVEGKLFRFCEGPAIGAEIPGSFILRRNVNGMVMHWIQVPADYLCQDGFVPQNLLDHVGRVNSEPMFVNPDTDEAQFEAGTVFLDTPTIEWYILPVETDDGSRLWVADIELPFMYFNPAMGNDPPPAGSPPPPPPPPPPPVFRGWNTAPHLPRTTEEFENVTERRWYAATHNGTPTGIRQIEQKDLMNIFKHWNDVES